MLKTFLCVVSVVVLGLFAVDCGTKGEKVEKPEVTLSEDSTAVADSAEVKDSVAVVEVDTAKKSQ